MNRLGFFAAAAGGGANIAFAGTISNYTSTATGSQTIPSTALPAMTPGMTRRYIFLSISGGRSDSGAISITACTINGAAASFPSGSRGYNEAAWAWREIDTADTTLTASVTWNNNWYDRHLQAVIIDSKVALTLPSTTWEGDLNSTAANSFTAAITRPAQPHILLLTATVRSSTIAGTLTTPSGVTGPALLDKDDQPGYNRARSFLLGDVSGLQTSTSDPVITLDGSIIGRMAGIAIGCG